MQRRGAAVAVAVVFLALAGMATSACAAQAQGAQQATQRTGSAPVGPGSVFSATMPSTANAYDYAKVVYQGKYLIVVSGNNPAGSGYPPSIVERYDLTNQVWSRADDLHYGRSGAVVEALDTKVLVMGGDGLEEGHDHVVEALEEYDYGLDQWTMIYWFNPRADAVTAVVNRKLYIAGGRYTPGGASVDTLQSYNFIDRFAALAPMPQAVLRGAGGGHDGKFYVFGGTVVVSDIESTATDMVQVYDIATNTWSTGAPMPYALYGRLGSYALDNDSVYVVGKNSADDEYHASTIFKYTYASDTWETITETENLPINFAVTSHNGIAYVVGGNPATNAVLSTALPVQMGDIQVVPNYWESRWTLTGPNDFVYQGAGTETVPGVEPGSYTVTWNNDVSGQLPPPPLTQDVPAGVTTTFSGSYSSAPTYYFAANDPEAGTTNTNYVARVTLNMNPSVEDDWIIFGFCEYLTPLSTVSAAYSQLFIDGVGEGQNTRKPVSPNDVLGFITVKVKHLTAGPHRLQIMFRTSSSSSPAYIRNARVCAIRKEFIEFWNVAQDNAVPLTVNLRDLVTLTWTPATQGNYLVISTAEINATTTVSTRLQTVYNGVVNDEGIMRAADNGDYTTFMSFNYLLGCPAGVPITHKITGCKMATDPINHYIRRARILALRLTDGRFRETGGYFATEKSTITITWVQALTGTIFTNNVRQEPVLMLNSARVLNTSTSCATRVRAQLRDTYTMGDQRMQPKHATDLLNFASMDMRMSVPGYNNHVDMDYCTSGSSGTAKVRRLRAYELPLAARYRQDF